MAKKTKVNKRRSKSKNGPVIEGSEERKQRLSNLLKQVSSENANSISKVAHEPLEVKDESLSKVLQRFETSVKAINENDIESQQAAVVRNEYVKNGDDEGGSSEDIDDDEEEVADDISKRQHRLASKPSIAILKASVPYPELIEWFDCDALWPFFNATIKSAHNTVGVPRHWQMKRGYLSGRAMLEKKPFELPDIIKQTDIGTMRETLPTGNEKDTEKLKDITRAKVQPKLGTLDLDYRRLYEAFFTLGKNWKPELLSFGDLYYEHRSLDTELEWKDIKTRFRPGYISESLREALNLAEGMLPPWCHEMNKSGLPKSYPDMKVCGINWDISNLTVAQYGYWPGDHFKNHTQKLFGSLISFEELEGKDADIDQNPLYESESEEEEPSVEEVEEVESVKTENNEETNVASVIFDGDPVIAHKYDENRPLFTVLTESKSYEAAESNVIGSGATYNVSKKRPQHAGDDTIENKKQKVEEGTDFRF
ncbi:unnamed protein product [Kluyveromyces dobzhanskii CBS 2104]|uniref:WGS project CCBQ000000000 data, contig 00015 n=1 Tax=Kluyveromyces dobzhanskii CBS 2104 TaxID=1427455 RepID=A0A0A8LC23_9SACH|nr:unnamed protein product [Kluyveromyces dobzhanskii CBS 2104]